MTQRTTPTTPAVPQPSPKSPWPDPAPASPTPRQPRHHDRADRVGTAQGVHWVLRVHLDHHGDECGPRCPDFALLFGELSQALEIRRPVAVPRQVRRAA